VRSIEVDCGASGASGWLCRVAVLDGDRTLSRHRVEVDRADLADLAPGQTEPSRLVEAAFAFLLERESANSILATFSITDIGRYFPGYEAEVRRRVETGEPR